MLDNIVRDLAALYALGHKAGPITKTVTAFIINRGTGGIPGFFERLKSKGLEDVANSWLGGAKDPKPISTEQINALLGTGGGLIGHIGSLFGLGTTTVSTILGFLLPKLVALLTPDGKIPNDPPAEIAALVGDPRSWLRGMTSEVAAAASAAAAPAKPAKAANNPGRRAEPRPTAGASNPPPARPMPASVAAASVATADEPEGGFPMWVPWLIVAALIPIILTMCNKEAVNTADNSAGKPTASNIQPAPATPAAAKPADAPPPDTAMTRNTAPVAPASPPAATASTPTQPAKPEAATSSAAAPAKPVAAPPPPAPAKSPTAATASKAPATVKAEPAAKPAAAKPEVAPKAAAPAASQASASGLPHAKIYFNFNKVLLPATGSKQLAPVVDYMKQHTNAHVVIAGFHDPTGNPAANEMLAKDRATRVRAALLKAGVPASAISMEKPAQTTGTGDHKEARRVEVTIKE